MFSELRKAFPHDDLSILKKISNRRNKLKTQLGPMYTKLSKKTKKKVDKKHDDEFELLSEDSRIVYSRLD